MPVYNLEAPSYASLHLSLSHSPVQYAESVPLHQASVRSVRDQEEANNQKKRKQRIWSLKTSKKLYSVTQDYCQEHSKMIDLLSVEDFAIIASSFDKSPKECMVKFSEIHISGSTTAGIWSTAEDQLLSSGVRDNMSWKDISTYINSVIHSGMKVRTAKHCKERWNNHTNPEIIKGKWTLQEDFALLCAYRDNLKKWSEIAKVLVTRNENAVKNRINSLLQREKKRYQIYDKEVAIERIFKRLYDQVNK